MVGKTEAKFSEMVLCIYKKPLVSLLNILAESVETPLRAAKRSSSLQLALKHIVAAR